MTSFRGKLSGEPSEVARVMSQPVTTPTSSDSVFTTARIGLLDWIRTEAPCFTVLSTGMVGMDSMISEAFRSLSRAAIRLMLIRSAASLGSISASEINNSISSRMLRRMTSSRWASAAARRCSANLLNSVVWSSNQASTAGSSPSISSGKRRLEGVLISCSWAAKITPPELTR